MYNSGCHALATDVHSMLFSCWASVGDGGSTFKPTSSRRLVSAENCCRYKICLWNNYFVDVRTHKAYYLHYINCWYIMFGMHTVKHEESRSPVIWQKGVFLILMKNELLFHVQLIVQTQKYVTVPWQRGVSRKKGIFVLLSKILKNFSFIYLI